MSVLLTPAFRSTFVSDTTPITGEINGILAVTDIVIASLTFVTGSQNQGSIAGTTILAGTVIKDIALSSIQLTSGTAQLFGRIETEL